MNYYRYLDVYDPPEEWTVYLEVKGTWTLRQILIGTNDTISSNVKHPQWGLRLPDQPVDYDSIAEVSQISKAEFDEVWNHHLANHTDQWRVAKSSYPLGVVTDATVEIMYPQGAIVTLDADTLGILSYAVIDKHTLYHNLVVQVVVVGYDEENQWIAVAPVSK